MGEDIEPSAEQTQSSGQLSHTRILVLMAILGILGAIAGFAGWSFSFGLGILLGTALSLINYFWLKSSLRSIFSAVESGERPTMLTGSYFLRYLALAIVVAIIYLTGLVPIVAVMLGVGAFGFAVVVEGLIRIFSIFFRKKEI